MLDGGANLRILLELDVFFGFRLVQGVFFWLRFILERLSGSVI